MYKSGRVMALALILYALQDLSLSQPFCWMIKCREVPGHWVPTFRRLALSLSTGSGPLDPEDEGTTIVRNVDLPCETPLKTRVSSVVSFVYVTVPILRLSRRTTGTYRVFCTVSDVNARACSHVCPLSGCCPLHCR